MVVLNKKAFWLPRLEKDKFVLLMGVGLEYDRAQGTYSVGNCNNIEKLLDALAKILKDDKVCFTQTCIVCREDFSCQDCSYLEMCSTKNLPFSCVCPQCLREGKATQE